jgi:hypothetical protein
MNYVQEFKALLREELPGCDNVLLDLYTLLGLTLGTDVTEKDVHDAWSIWKNPVDAQHRSLVPFNKLSREVQDLDTKYVNAIYKVARKLKY